MSLGIFMHQTPEHRPSALMGSQISNQLELVTQPGRKMSKNSEALQFYQIRQL